MFVDKSYLIGGIHPPFVIHMMLAIYTCPDDPEIHMWLGAFGSLMGIETVQVLRGHGMITDDNKITEIGRDWLKKVLSVPFPDGTDNG